MIRIEWSEGNGAAPELLAVPRAIGDERKAWRAATSKTTHPGPEHRRNTKTVYVEAYDLAREEARDTGVDEVLLFDADGLLVEGGHSNFLIVTDSGKLVTPDPALGSVEGLGLSIVLESAAPVEFARLRREDLTVARELMSVNAVRGVVPIVELDGRPVADGPPGGWSKRLRKIFRLD